MHKLYKNYCEESGKTPENEAFYTKNFVENFNLAFHHPKNDTCGNATVKIKIEAAEDEQQKKSAEEEREKHLDLVESSYSEKR